MKTKYKVGDWCFCEFKLQQIKGMDGDRITCVTDGFFSHSGHDLSDRCFPLEMKVKTSSEEIETWYKSIRDAAGNFNINYPEIHNKFIELWVHLCENTEHDILYAKYWEELQNFGIELTQKLRDLKYEEVQGIKLIR